MGKSRPSRLTTRTASPRPSRATSRILRRAETPATLAYRENRQAPSTNGLTGSSRGSIFLFVNTTTACNALLVAPRCVLVIGRGQTYSVKHKARAILSGEALPVAVNTGLAAGFKLPADYDGEQYEVIADGEPNGGWFLSRSAARAHATALSAQGYDTVSVRRVSLAD